NASIHSPYGMTEGLLLTDIDRAGVAEADATGGLGVCVGRPIDGVELALAPIDANGGSADELVQGPQAQGRLARSSPAPATSNPATTTCGGPPPIPLATASRA